MTRSPLSLAAVDAQEERLAAAFARGDIAMATALYQPDVVYVSPTTRLFGWPARIVGRDQAFEFIQVTISGLSDIAYSVDERALIPDSGGDAGGAQGAAYVRVHFDFNMRAVRLRSTYVVVYRYRDALIAQQELYYDPSGELEILPWS
ncbi:MAG TPA: nuclear transport factor 2 family protein [Acidimicrobiales bacterium]|nr:nuclear transport factor 2 family protein [Acidimicrobiales bacterium]